MVFLFGLHQPGEARNRRVWVVANTIEVEDVMPAYTPSSLLAYGVSCCLALAEISFNLVESCRSDLPRCSILPFAMKRWLIKDRFLFMQIENHHSEKHIIKTMSTLRWKGGGKTVTATRLPVE